MKKDLGRRYGESVLRREEKRDVVGLTFDGRVLVREGHEKLLLNILERKLMRVSAVRRGRLLVRLGLTPYEEAVCGRKPGPVCDDHVSSIFKGEWRLMRVGGNLVSE